MYHYCPRCKAEYFSHVLTCVDCAVELANEPNQADSAGPVQESMAMPQSPVVFNQGPLDALKEMASHLKKSNINCAILPERLEGDDSAATIGAAGQKKYLLLISETEVDRAKHALEEVFAEQVRKEGQGSLVREAVNLEHGEITCPACGEASTPVDGECTACGLFLGETPEMAAPPWKK